MKLFSKEFLEYAGERMLKSAAQAALALLTLDSVDVLTVDWTSLAVASGTYALYSLLTSVVAWTSTVPVPPAPVEDTEK